MSFGGRGSPAPVGRGAPAGRGMPSLRIPPSGGRAAPVSPPGPGPRTGKGMVTPPTPPRPVTMPMDIDLTLTRTSSALFRTRCPHRTFLPDILQEVWTPWGDHKPSIKDVPQGWTSVELLPASSSVGQSESKAAGVDEIEARLLLCCGMRPGDAHPARRLEVVVAKEREVRGYITYGGAVQRGPEQMIVGQLIKLAKDQSMIELERAPHWIRLCEIRYYDRPPVVYYMPSLEENATYVVAPQRLGKVKPEVLSLSQLMEFSDPEACLQTQSLCIAADCLDLMMKRTMATRIRTRLVGSAQIRREMEEVNAAKRQRLSEWKDVCGQLRTRHKAEIEVLVHQWRAMDKNRPEEEIMQFINERREKSDMLAQKYALPQQPEEESKADIKDFTAAGISRVREEKAQRALYDAFAYFEQHAKDLTGQLPAGRLVNVIMSLGAELSEHEAWDMVSGLVSVGTYPAGSIIYRDLVKDAALLHGGSDGPAAGS
eukprot:Hpha_TRINITY_DN16208_c1_g2::TRINITY_DN16208_c1_g2_i1::g.15378::m.15378